MANNRLDPQELEIRSEMHVKMAQMDQSIWAILTCISELEIQSDMHVKMAQISWFGQF